MRIRTSAAMVAAGCVVVSGLAVGTPGSSAAPPDSSKYPEGMLAALASSRGISTDDAARRLDRQRDQQSALDRLSRADPSIDGAYFDDSGTLVTNVHTDASAQRVRAAGLVPRRVARGEKWLERQMDKASRLAQEAGYTGVNGLAVDVPGDAVIVDLDSRTTSAAARALRNRLTAVDGVRVTWDSVGPAGPAGADAVPGRVMSMATKSCTLGFNGRRSGNSIMYTVGHCVVGGPLVRDYSGNILGRGAGSTYRPGQTSADFGQIDIMTGVDQWLNVDTRVPGSYYAPSGMSRLSVGATICKAGDTTGWTCGNIKAQYTSTVYRDPGQPDTPVVRLGWAELCVEKGDSGGPIIAGTTAVGMVSGLVLDGHECYFNRGRYGTNNLSFFVYILDVVGQYGGDILHT